MTFAASRRVHAPVPASSRVVISHAETSPVVSIIHLFMPRGKAKRGPIVLPLLLKSPEAASHLVPDSALHRSCHFQNIREGGEKGLRPTVEFSNRHFWRWATTHQTHDLDT